VTLSDGRGGCCGVQADLVEQQSINNYQIEMAAQEREKVRAIGRIGE
jgi:hypothetical protein